jgi:hypothetical protein
MAARIAMITMTMRSSTMVKAGEAARFSCFSEDKKDLKDEKQQHPYDLIFYYSYLYKVIRHGENPIEGGTIRSLRIPHYEYIP